MQAFAPPLSFRMAACATAAKKTCPVFLEFKSLFGLRRPDRFLVWEEGD
jgi:hypothetical protein